ncbi:MAG: hydroxyacylglutathione hydrolase [Aquabacterium sp.]|nr:hydroxyacylglutathione hydrolase [Aquabacterium sp.]
MKLVALPAFTDNYIWMLHDDRQAIVVDPGDAAPVAAALDGLGLALAAILVTHHHPDHVGGVAALRPRLQGGQVWGPARESIPLPFLPLADGDVVDLLGLRFQVIDVPGHTAGHIAYYLPATGDGEAPVLFCGDTLFSGGCGRLFEGTPAQMHQSLGRLAGLPGNTRVCCAHEYTESNLKFAQAVEPANAALARYTVACRALRAGGLPTLPSTIAQERAINPFMRCNAPDVITAAQTQGAADASGPAVLGALRAWKNQFR